MRRIALVVSALALISCSALSASPAPSSSSSDVPTAAPSVTAAPSASQGLQSTPTETALPPSDAPSTAEPDGTSTPNTPTSQDLQLPAGAVETQSLAGIGGGSKPIRYLYQDAELFFFAVGGTVYGVQFGKANNPDVMAQADDGQQVLGIDGGVSDWYWAEGSYDQHTGRVPCADSGALNWRLVPSNAIVMSAPQFTYSRVRFCAAAPPMFAMDGSNIAVAVEAPRDGYPLAWEISLLSTFNGTTLRTVETDGDLFGLDLSGEDIAWVEGDYDVNVDPNFAFNTRLRLSTAAHPDSVLVAEDAYGVSFDGGRLAWSSDPQVSRRDDNAAPSALMTTSIDNLKPEVLTTDPAATGSSPVAAGDYVTWSADQQVFLWNAPTNTTWHLQGTGDAGQASARGGWLTWVGDDRDGVQSLNAVDLQTLFPPAPTPTPKPTPPATPLPSASLAKPETIVVDGVTWSRFEHSALPDLEFLNGVTETGNGFLVLGLRCAFALPDYAGGCGQSEVLLSSSDGSGWTELGTVATYPDGGVTGPFYRDQTQILAPGSSGPEDSVETGIWRSIDGGLNWDFITDPVFNAGKCVGDRGGVVGEIVSDGTQLIAFGTGIWESVNGLTWECLSPAPRFVIKYGHSVFVGTGATDSSSLPDWFWLSNDGVSWQQIQKAPINSSITPVAAGFVALGGGERFSPPNEVLTSADGHTWADQLYPFGDRDMGQLASDGNRAALLEGSDLSGTPDPGAVWVSSTDGTTWTRYQLPVRDGDSADSVAILGDRVVVTGSSYNNGNSDGSGVIWSAQLP